MLKIQKQLNQRDNTSVIGPKYNVKYEAFFKKAESEFIASAGKPNTKTIERLADEYINIIDADPIYRNRDYKTEIAQINTQFIRNTFASIGYNSMEKLLPPKPASIDFEICSNASQSDLDRLSQYKKIYYLYCRYSEIYNDCTILITEFTRHKSFLKDGFTAGAKHYQSLKSIITKREHMETYYETEKNAELASIQMKACIESQMAFSKIFDTSWQKFEEKLKYREEIFLLSSYLFHDPSRLKRRNKELVFDVVQSEIKNYRIFLEFIAKFDLATKLQQRIYLGEEISIDNFFSKDAEIQLPLKLIHTYLTKILT